MRPFDTFESTSAGRRLLQMRQSTCNIAKQFFILYSCSDAFLKRR